MNTKYLAMTYALHQTAEVLRTRHPETHHSSNTHMRHHVGSRNPKPV